MAILQEISELLQKGNAKKVVALVEHALAAGVPAQEILDNALLAGMDIIGEKFKNNEVYVPEVLLSARAMNMGAEVLKPHLSAEATTDKGTVILGTVKGDKHDIGKNLVRMMMEGKGLKVVDLGVDVDAAKFIEAAKENDAKVIACSALLTTTMGVMEEVVKLATEKGIRDNVKIMIGGAPVNEDYRAKIGADAYTSDAASAADAAVKFCTK
jgi:corrinoid protein of di/trimethylamine methyltransferase